MEPRVKKLLLNGSFGDSLINFRRQLIIELTERGYDVHVSAPGISDEVRRQLKEIGAIAHEVPLHRAGLNPFHDMIYFFTLLRLMRRHKIHVVIGYTAKPNIWGSLAAKLAGAKSFSIVTGLGYTFMREGEKKFSRTKVAVHRLYRIAAQINERVVFQNPDDPKDFAAAGCLNDPEKVVVVNGSGVDTGYFRQVPLPDGPNFLLIARLLKSKGILEYAHAAHALREQLPSARFRLAGPLDDGPDGISPSDLDRVRSAGIEYLGSLSDVRPAIADSSVFVLPSTYREGTPRTLLEAMSMGRPLITTDMPGCRETVLEGINGLLLEPDDQDSLLRAMLMLGLSREKRQRMGEASRLLALEKYDAVQVNRYLVSAVGL